MNESELMTMCAALLGGTYEGLKGEHPFLIEAPCHVMKSADGDVAYMFIFNRTLVVTPPYGDGYMLISLSLDADTFNPSIATVGSVEAASQMLRDLAYSS